MNSFGYSRIKCPTCRKYLGPTSRMLGLCLPCRRDSGSGAQAMRREAAQPVGPQSGGEQPHRPNSVKAG
jgi:hypothetical protein